MLDRIADGRTDLVFDFLAAGNAATSRDRHGTPLLAWCAYHGDVSAIRHLLANGESLRVLGENLDLNGAAFHGHPPLCKFLLGNGADANHALPDTGETPLHSALCKANRPVYEQVVEVLLAHGANPNAVTKPGVTTDAFMRDCRTKGETPLHRAAAFCSERCIQMLRGRCLARGQGHARGLTALVGELAPASGRDPETAVLRFVLDPSGERLDLRPRHGVEPGEWRRAERARSQPVRDLPGERHALPDRARPVRTGRACRDAARAGCA